MKIFRIDSSLNNENFDIIFTFFVVEYLKISCKIPIENQSLFRGHGEFDFAANSNAYTAIPLIPLSSVKVES